MTVAAFEYLNMEEYPSIWGSRSVECFEKPERMGEETYGFLKALLVLRQSVCLITICLKCYKDALQQRDYGAKYENHIWMLLLLGSLQFPHRTVEFTKHLEVKKLCPI